MSNKQEKARNKQADKSKMVAEKIQVILLKYNMALQPFIDSSPYAIIPRVRLVDTSKQDNVEQTGDSVEAGDNQEADGATQPE